MNYCPEFGPINERHLSLFTRYLLNFKEILNISSSAAELLEFLRRRKRVPNCRPLPIQTFSQKFQDSSHLVESRAADPDDRFEDVRSRDAFEAELEASAAEALQAEISSVSHICQQTSPDGRATISPPATRLPGDSAGRKWLLRQEMVWARQRSARLGELEQLDENNLSRCSCCAYLP